MNLDIPADWVTEYNRVAKAAPDGVAILAGGALRDLDNGRPFKDLDFFIHATQDDVLDVMMALNVNHIDAIPSQYLEVMRDEVSAIISYITPDLLECQVICLNIPVSLPEALSRIDLGFCRIGWDGTTLHRTPAYLTDQANKTMTMMLDVPELQRVRSYNRFARLHNKYPEFSYKEDPMFAFDIGG